MSKIDNFEAFGLNECLLRAIDEMGYTQPTPIQSEAIPHVLSGGDVMGAAQTGTGKTASFALPVLERLLPLANTSMSPARHPVRALILTPTRELADQIHENVLAYSKYTSLRTACVFGGVDIKPQATALRGGVEVLTATPGRLLDHIEQRNTNLSQVQMVVLDEADRMLDMGFLPDISRILNLLPKSRQSLLFSATFSPEIKKLAANFLNNPKLIEVSRGNSTARTITQRFMEVHDSEKFDALLDILDEPECDEAHQLLLFVNSKITCRRLTRSLEKQGIKADSIHGDKNQEERTKTLEAFKNGNVKVLVATDVAARGLDIADLPVVINYDVPFNAEDYVHRIGRTGRAGAKGLAITLVTAGADDKNLHAIETLVKQKFELTRPDVRRHRRGACRTARRTYTQPPTSSVSADPFFDQPYEPSSQTQAQPETFGKIKAVVKEKSKRVMPALLARNVRN